LANTLEKTASTTTNVQAVNAKSKVGRKVGRDAYRGEEEPFALTRTI
jgi:hypothetical protein